MSTTLWADGRLCRLCLINTRIEDIYRLNLDSNTGFMLRKLSTLINSNSRTAAFTESFNIVKRIAGSTDPYAMWKKILNEIGARAARMARSYLESVGWRVEEALRISAAANIIDTSVLGYEPKGLEEALWDKPVIEELPLLPREDPIYLVLDNAGEALVDLVLAEALKINGYNVNLVIREESYEIDVIREDLEDVGDFNIIETPGSMPAILHMGEGYVIAKGIANLEAYLEAVMAGRNVKTLHLLRAKCDVLARRFNVPKNAPLIVGGERVKELFLVHKNSTTPHQMKPF